MLGIFSLIVLIFSVILHEVSHGYVADKLGDPTARNLGRLTLNPLKHIDPVGSIILPLLLYYLTSGGFVFGWAKPVPFDPRFLRNPRRDAGRIAAAGPITNLLLAAVFGGIVRILTSQGQGGSILTLLLYIIVEINVGLAIFNLVPIPPLDGSKVLYALLPFGETSLRVAMFLEQYGLIFLGLFLLWGSSLISPVIRVVTGFFAG